MFININGRSLTPAILALLLHYDPCFRSHSVYQSDCSTSSQHPQHFGNQSPSSIYLFPYVSVNLLSVRMTTISLSTCRYIILQGLSGVAGGFLQIVPLIIYYAKLYLLSSTPRSIWGIKYGLRSDAWGTLFPNTTLLVVISMSSLLVQ